MRRLTLLAGVIMALGIQNIFAANLLEIGSEAPGFKLKTESGETVSLEDHKGKENVVLIFYPGDNTPGCTSQLCAVRDDWEEFKDKEVAVYGVNPADAASHQKFVDDHKFPFPLIVDEAKSMAKDYRADGMLFVSRTVYGIDKEGRIVFAEKGMPANEKILKSFK